MFDDEDADNSEDDYENVYATLKRVQELISRKSVEGFMDDDCGKLSQTLSKLVETCSGPRVMRLWSENARVCFATSAHRL